MWTRLLFSFFIALAGIAPLSAHAQAPRLSEAMQQRQQEQQRLGLPPERLGQAPGLRHYAPATAADGTYVLGSLSPSASRVAYFSLAWLLLAVWSIAVLVRSLPGRALLARAFKANAGLGLLALPVALLGLAQALLLADALAACVMLEWQPALTLPWLASLWAAGQLAPHWAYAAQFPMFAGLAALAAALATYELAAWTVSLPVEWVLGRRAAHSIRRAAASRSATR